MAFVAELDGRVRQLAMRHQDKGYDYSATVYVDAVTKIGVKCSEHGVFWQLPSNHAKGTGCPKCSKQRQKQGTFKQLCKDLGIDYWRALKRREAGMSKEKIVAQEYVRGQKQTASAITVHGVFYPNIMVACAALEPIASPVTIERWVAKGMTPEDAFARVPNPGYRNGIIYCVTHKPSGKRYIGLTVQSLERRWRYHQEQAAAGNIKSPLSLHAAIRRFGASAFDVIEVDQGKTKVDLEARERKWILELKTRAPTGFNLDPGGVSGGSSAKPTWYNGVLYGSVYEAAMHLAAAKGIGLEAAKKRIFKRRTEVRKPAMPGESMVKSKIYKTWSGIVHASTNPASKGYIPGATVCDSWLAFDDFYADVGDAPAGMCFARKDKSMPFNSENCAWMTKSEASKINAAHMKAIGTLVGRRRSSVDHGEL